MGALGRGGEAGSPMQKQGRVGSCQSGTVRWGLGDLGLRLLRTVVESRGFCLFVCFLTGPQAW